MDQEYLNDAVFGKEGRIIRSSMGDWAGFKTVFAPTQTAIAILVDVQGDCVSESQHELFRQIVSWYPNNQELLGAIARQIEIEGIFSSMPTFDEITKIFRLTSLDIRCASRHANGRDWGWGFNFRFDANAPELYVTMSDDFHVKYCGLKD